MKSSNGVDESKQFNDYSYLKVHINDKLSKLEEVYSYDQDISGSFIYKGELLENMSDKTFAKNFVSDGA